MCQQRSQKRPSSGLEGSPRPESTPNATSVPVGWPFTGATCLLAPASGTGTHGLWGSSQPSATCFPATGSLLQSKHKHIRELRRLASVSGEGTSGEPRPAPQGTATLHQHFLPRETEAFIFSKSSQKSGLCECHPDVRVLEEVKV